MATVTHGIGTSKQATSVSTPNVAASGIVFAVGAAPVQTVGGKVNEVIMANSYEEAVSALGYSDDWEKYGLCEVVYTMFQLYQQSPVFLVNVLDPAKHKKQTTESYTPENNQIRLPLEAIASSINIAEKTAGEDYEVFYDETACVIEFAEDVTTETSVTFDEVDTTKLAKADVIGGYEVSTHKNKGLELIDDVFAKYTEAPDLIICPNWSKDSEVAAVMSAKAENINGMFEAHAIIDVDTAATGGATYYSDVPAWKKSKNIMKANELLCFPKLKLGDRAFNYSSQLAGLIAQTDNTEALGGGTPCESASNKTLQADSMVLEDGTEVVLDIQKANYLNDNGVITALNFYNGWVSWGNWSACYPANTDPVDYFYCISRMFKWVAKTVTLSYWNYVDRKLTRRLIDTILQGVNDWLNSLTAEEIILGGRVEMREDENTTTSLMAGKVKFHVYITPPSPMVQMEYTLEYDVSYLQNLLAA
ncbi:phage tail protein [Lachnoclostridium sp. An169]|uniref:phage tail sheath family protein n=1 Tax=Lachnoclostridium sp. An169 TaxID=1965569 RepID=UPI000B364B98|nr:phage tail protein [Lachnoclostridium sp. An169]OUP81206.1 phage tail protein [Lachnoclostridium sp. An169]